MTHTHACVININCFYWTSWIFDNNNFYHIFIIQITYFDISQFKFPVKQIFLKTNKICIMYLFLFILILKTNCHCSKFAKFFWSYRLFQINDDNLFNIIVSKPSILLFFIKTIFYLVYYLNNNYSIINYNMVIYKLLLINYFITYVSWKESYK